MLIKSPEDIETFKKMYGVDGNAEGRATKGGGEIYR